MRRASRLRPHLGTFVEVELAGKLAARRADELFAAAYGEIAEVERLMSFHSPESDLMRINRAPPGRWVTVHPWTTRVLEMAEDLRQASAGAFDVSTGGALVSWGLLPERGQAGRAARVGWGPAYESSGERVRRLWRALLDLGGIAKGFAVDRAVSTLLEMEPALSGSVNAGGDLRVFGPEASEVAVRARREPGETVLRFRLRECAVATSAVIPVRVVRAVAGTSSGRRVSAHVRARTFEPLLARRSASVFSRECMLADALTKVVLMGERGRAAACIERFAEDALVSDPNGMTWLLGRSRAAG